MKNPLSKSSEAKRLHSREGAAEVDVPQEEVHTTSTMLEEQQMQTQQVEDDVATSPTQPLVSVSRRPKPGKQRVPVVATVAVLLLLGVSLLGWRFVVKPMMVPDVTLYTVKSESAPQTIGGSGILYPLQQYDVTYPNSEFVVAVNVKAGDRVKRGQSLVQLDPGLLSAQIKQASDDLSSAQTYLNKVEGSGSAVSIAQAQQQYNVAQSKYNALLNQASALHNGNLTSTMDGIVTTVNINPGQVAAANSILLTVMDESTVIVRAKVPLADLGQVQVGQLATVSPSVLPDLSFPGKVTAVIPQADPQTDTFEVWVSVANTSTQLLPGMSAFAHIQAQRSALALPHLSVLNLDSDPQVFVVDSALRIHLRHVRVIARTPDVVFVDSGVRAGDRVVLVGIDNLLDGQRVHATRVEGAIEKREGLS